MSRPSEKSLGISVVGLVLLLTIVDFTNGHVALTFPPARKYNLDFLDNIRTPGPCGMAKGMGPVSFLYSGIPFNVTWHLAYPHKARSTISLSSTAEVDLFVLAMTHCGGPTPRMSFCVHPTGHPPSCEVIIDITQN